MHTDFSAEIMPAMARGRILEVTMWRGEEKRLTRRDRVGVRD